MLLIANRFTFIALGTLAAFVAGCSAEASDSSSRRTSAGLANACTEGQERLADDGCNTCQCNDGQWSCTELACVGEDNGDAPAPCTDPPSSGSGSSGSSSGSGSDAEEPDVEDPHGSVSNEGEPACVDGEATMAEDGCNTCECISGAWSCTELACGN